MASRTANGNVFILGGSVSVSGDSLTADIIVEIGAEKVEEILDNELIEHNQPVTPGNKSSTAPQASIIDLKRIRDRLNIRGPLATDSNESALTKKQNLMILAGYGSNAQHSLMSGKTIRSSAVTVVWGLDGQSTQQKIDGSIKQISITELADEGHGDGTTSETHPVSFGVIMSVAVGSERG